MVGISVNTLDYKGYRKIQAFIKSSWPQAFGNMTHMNLPILRLLGSTNYDTRTCTLYELNLNLYMHLVSSMVVADVSVSI